MVKRADSHKRALSKYIPETSQAPLQPPAHWPVCMCPVCALCSSWPERRQGDGQAGVRSFNWSLDCLEGAKFIHDDGNCHDKSHLNNASSDGSCLKPPGQSVFGPNSLVLLKWQKTNIVNLQLLCLMNGRRASCWFNMGLGAI